MIITGKPVFYEVNIYGDTQIYFLKKGKEFLPIRAFNCFFQWEDFAKNWEGGENSGLVNTMME